MPRGWYLQPRSSRRTTKVFNWSKTLYEQIIPITFPLALVLPSRYNRNFCHHFRRFKGRIHSFQSRNKRLQA